MIRFTQLDAGTRPAFETLLREIGQHQTWCAKLAQDVVQWRYFDRSNNSATWLAMEGDTCVATLDSMLRPYPLDGQRILVRETADWYCVSRLRLRALGLRLMLHLKMYPESVFVLGGSPTNVNLLSKMPGWTPLPPAVSFVLPVRARGLVANWVRRQTWWSRERLTRAIPACIPVKIPRKIRTPPGATWRFLTPNDMVPVSIPDRSGLVQLCEQEHWAWFAQQPPDLARPLGVEFLIDGAVMGFALMQEWGCPAVC